MSNIYKDQFDVLTLHVNDPYAAALEKQGIMRKKLPTPQRKSTVPMHAGDPRRNKARFQHEQED